MSSDALPSMAVLYSGQLRSWSKLPALLDSQLAVLNALAPNGRASWDAFAVYDGSLGADDVARLRQLAPIASERLVCDGEATRHVPGFCAVRQPGRWCASASQVEDFLRGKYHLGINDRQELLNVSLHSVICDASGIARAYSLMAETVALQRRRPYDVVVRLRFDQLFDNQLVKQPYATSISVPQIRSAVGAGHVVVPATNNWFGVNDRFAIGPAGAMARYAQRRQSLFDSQLMRACKAWAHPEKHLQCTLCAQNVSVVAEPLGLFTVRTNGMKQMAGNGRAGLLGYWRGGTAWLGSAAPGSDEEGTSSAACAKAFSAQGQARPSQVVHASRTHGITGAQQQRTGAFDSLSLSHAGRRPPWFSRAAKTGSSTLIAMLSTTRDSSEACSRLQFSMKHTDLRAPRHTDPVAVLREPADRFVSAFYYAVSELREHGPNRTGWEWYESSAVDRWCGPIYRSQPTLSRLERLASTGSPLAFAQALLSDSSERSLWLGTSLRVRGSSCSVTTPCGGSCGFVPQAEYLRGAQSPQIACLPCIDNDVQRILDTTVPGCKLALRHVCHNCARESSTVSTKHPTAQGLSPPVRGSRDATEDEKLRNLVAKLYPRDVQLWKSKCSWRRCVAGGRA